MKYSDMRDIQLSTGSSDGVLDPADLHEKKVRKAQYNKCADCSGDDVKNIKHGSKCKCGHSGLSKGDKMNYSKMLESMNTIMEGIEEDSTDIKTDSIPENISEKNDNNDDELLKELNQIFTPILVMQGIEGDMSDKINEAFSEASVLMEKNIIKFDDETRMAQLISICALLIARKKNSEKYQMYQKAATIKNQMKIEIQKDEYDAAKALAQKYLVNVSTTNNSSVARDAANDLLPQTQH